MPRLQDLKLKYLTIQPDNTTDNGLTINGNADFNSNVSISSDLNVTGNTTITGDLTVEGTTTTIESVTTVYQDPILQIGGTTAPESDDGKDRGVSFLYYDNIADATKTGFMGYDNDADGFTFLTGATINSSEVVVSGTNASITCGAVDSSGIGDFADTLTCSKGTGTGLSVTANATIGGDLTLTEGSVSITDAGDATSLSVTNNTITTDALVDISSTSLTTGAMMRINANTADHDGEVLELINAGDATSTGTGLSVTMPSVITGAATGINVTMAGATTTAKGISVTMDAITTGDMLYLDNGGATMTGDGKFINCNDDDISQFSVGAKGLTTITGDASGTDALVITKGDILVSSGHIGMTVGDLTLTNGSVSITDAGDATSLSVTNNTITTADSVTIVSNALTTGSALDISATNASLTGPVINITGGSATANEYNAFTPIYQQINSVQRGNIKFSWTASAAAAEVDVGVDLPFPTGVCVVTDIFIITTNATSTPTITLGLLSSETSGAADGFLVNVTQTAAGVQSVYTNAFKGAFNTDSGDNIPTRWNCPFNAGDAQSRSISMTLSATGSVGTIIMEYIGMDV